MVLIELELISYKLMLCKNRAVSGRYNQTLISLEGHHEKQNLIIFASAIMFRRLQKNCSQSIFYLPKFMEKTHEKHYKYILKKTYQFNSFFHPGKLMHLNISNNDSTKKNC